MKWYGKVGLGLAGLGLLFGIYRAGLNQRQEFVKSYVGAHVSSHLIDNCDSSVNVFGIADEVVSGIPKRNGKVIEDSVRNRSYKALNDFMPDEKASEIANKIADGVWDAWYDHLELCRRQQIKEREEIIPKDGPPWDP
jgi:hypothetical protein